MGAMTYFSPFCVALLACLMLAPLAEAGSHKSSDDLQNLSRIELLPGWMRDDGWYMAAIRVELSPGWKTYWREPGANGIAPEFDWSASSNLTQVAYFWPTPGVYEDYGTRTIGYEHELILPVLLRPSQVSAPIRARLVMDYGVCDDICVPARSEATATFTAGPAANQELIGRSVALRPRSGRAAGMRSATCSLARNGADFVLNAAFTFSGRLQDMQAVVVESGSDAIWVSDTDHTQSGRNLSVEADLKHYGDGPMALNRDALRFTLIGTTHTIDIQGCQAG